MSRLLVRVLDCDPVRSHGLDSRCLTRYVVQEGAVDDIDLGTIPCREDGAASPKRHTKVDVTPEYVARFADYEIPSRI